MDTDTDLAADYLRRIERQAKAMHTARKRAAAATDDVASSVQIALAYGWISEAAAARLVGVSRTTIRQWRTR